MSKVRFQQTISLDGYSAGPDQREEEPLGTGGEELHEWMFGLEAWLKAHGKEGGEVNASTPVAEALESGYGAVIMGRNMFGPIGGGDWGGGDYLDLMAAVPFDAPLALAPSVRIAGAAPTTTRTKGRMGCAKSQIIHLPPLLLVP